MIRFCQSHHCRAPRYFRYGGHYLGGGIGGCILGGAAGYWEGITVAGIAYNWAEDTRFRPLMLISEAEVRDWLHRDGD